MGARGGPDQPGLLSASIRKYGGGLKWTSKAGGPIVATGTYGGTSDNLDGNLYAIR